MKHSKPEKPTAMMHHFLMFLSRIGLVHGRLGLFHDWFVPDALETDPVLNRIVRQGLGRIQRLRLKCPSFDACTIRDNNSNTDYMPGPIDIVWNAAIGDKLNDTECLNDPRLILGLYWPTLLLIELNPAPIGAFASAASRETSLHHEMGHVVRDCLFPFARPAKVKMIRSAYLSQIYVQMMRLAVRPILSEVQELEQILVLDPDALSNDEHRTIDRLKRKLGYLLSEKEICADAYAWAFAHGDKAAHEALLDKMQDRLTQVWPESDKAPSLDPYRKLIRSELNLKSRNFLRLFRPSSWEYRP